ncbi:MAG TPA: porin family protein [Candidatus Kapabacteria bacterium]
MISRFRFALFFCVLSTLYFAPTPCSAQYSVGWMGSTTWIGLRAGGNFANETPDSTPLNTSTSLKSGFVGGLTVEHWFNNNLAVGASVLYDQKGTNQEYADAAKNRQIGNTIYSGSDAYALSYCEIPVVIKYAIGTGLVRPYVCVGPSFGLLLSATETPGGSLASVDNFKSYTNSSEVSLYAALGVMDEILHGPIFFFEAGIAGGLTGIYQSNPSRITTNDLAFPDPIDPFGSKSLDIRVTAGAMWEL